MKNTSIKGHNEAMSTVWDAIFDRNKTRTIICLTAIQSLDYSIVIVRLILYLNVGLPNYDTEQMSTDEWW